MATIRTGDAGIDLSAAYLSRYRDLQITGLLPTQLDATFQFLGQPGYILRLTGSFTPDLGDSARQYGLTGVVTGVRETINDALRLEVSGVSIPFTALGDSSLLPTLLSGNDFVQGGAGNDVLRAYAGNNVIAGGAGADIAAIDAARSATLSFRYADQAVVYRYPAGQWDKLGSIETVRFIDRDYALAELPEFKPLEYLASYPDLAAAYGTDQIAAWQHFAATGIAEGRLPSFSGLNYIASYPDLIRAFGTDAEAGAQHYLTTGRAEGRTVSFDGLRYIASNPTLIPIVPHTVEAGALRFITGRPPGERSIDFDPLRYLASNLDIARAYGADEARGLDHWISKGFMENRGIGTFSAAQYLANYADLRAAFGTDERAATLHWITAGAAEGRSARDPNAYRWFGAAETSFSSVGFFNTRVVWVDTTTLLPPIIPAAG